MESMLKNELISEYSLEAKMNRELLEELKRTDNLDDVSSIHNIIAVKIGRNNYKPIEFKEGYEKLDRIIIHKREIIRIAKELGVYETYKERLDMHDLDKILLSYVIGEKKASEYHRNTAEHHNPIEKEDFIEAILDWESARFTKPDKPLNAYETYIKYYRDTVSEYERGQYEKYLKELKLWRYE